MSVLKLWEDLWLVDLAIYLPDRITMVIADLHLGYEEALNRDGVLVPRNHLQKVEERLEKIFAHLGVSSENKLERLIINGDLKHQFGPLSRQEWKESLELLEFLAKRAHEIVLLEGNHDRKLGLLTERFAPLEIGKLLKEGSHLFIHGDELPRELNGIRLVVIGHEHPAVSLRSSVTGRSETYKAFLKGSFQGKELLVQPSFNLLVKGSDLTKERAISPLIDKARLGEFEIYPVSDEGKIYDFGKLRRASSMPCLKKFHQRY